MLSLSLSPIQPSAEESPAKHLETPVSDMIFLCCSQEHSGGGMSLGNPIALYAVVLPHVMCLPIYSFSFLNLLSLISLQISGSHHLSYSGFLVAYYVSYLFSNCISSDFKQRLAQVCKHNASSLVVKYQVHKNNY